MNWAVLGASGFVGSRLVEKMHLSGAVSVRPIVRNFSSLARLARFELDWRVTDLTDVPKLTEALEGCDVLVHSIVGDESVILGSISQVYNAANQAGIRRIIYLSSSAVHGLAPEIATIEETPISDQQPFSYNNAKVKAEKLWSKVRSTGRVEVVGLRPSIVFGPRSRWCSDLAEQALSGTAYLLQQGNGICNTIYVDNLIEAIILASKAPGIDGQYFFVRDRETVIWNDFYAPILTACGVPLDHVHQVEAPTFSASWHDRLSRFRTLPFLRKIKTLSPPSAIRMGKAALNALPSPPPISPWPEAEQICPKITAEMAALQQCTWRMPLTQAEKLLGYEPTTSFSEGMERSIGWLKFAGYPVEMAGT